MCNVKKILIISSDENLLEVLYFCLEGWGYEVLIDKNTSPDISSIKKKSPDLIIIDIHSARPSDLQICKLLKEDFLTASIPVITLINKRQLRTHLLNLRQGVDDYLIKPPDPLDLRVRVEMALRRTQYSFYTNSLTGLPGSRMIEEVLKERLNKRINFSFGYIDIDNFKSFNDCYGYLQGDNVILQVAYILYTTIKEFGGEDDFIGHIGGDDFVFITTPYREIEICKAFIREFDRLIPLHYLPQDRSRGYIISKDRTGKERKIPLMSVSIAVVNTQDREFKSILEINEALKSIKSYLKNLPGSKFMIERRKEDWGRQKRGNFLSSKTSLYRELLSSDTKKPLGQILLEKGYINKEELDNILVLHWKKGLRLGEILKEKGILDEKTLDLLLQEQR